MEVQGRHIAHITGVKDFLPFGWMDEWLGGRLTAPLQILSSIRATLQFIQCGL